MISHKTKITCVSVMLGLVVFSSFLCAEEWFGYYEKAEKAFKLKNYSQAISNYTEAIKLKNEAKLGCKTWGVRLIDYLPYYYTGLSYFNLGNYEQAQKYFTESLRWGAIKGREDLFKDLNRKLEICKEKLAPPVQEPTTPVVTHTEVKESQNAIQISQYITEGDKFRTIGDFASAHKQYSNAKNLIELSGEKTNLLGDVTRKLAEAIHAERLAQADDFVKQNRFDEAISMYQTLLKEDRSDEKVKSLLKQAQFARERFLKTLPPDSSTATPTPVIPNGEQNSATLLEQGKQLVKQGNWQNARDKFEAVLQLVPNNPDAVQGLQSIAAQFLNKGIELYFNGDIVSSEQFLNKAIDILSIQPLPSINSKILVNTYLFKAVVLIEKHFLDEDTSGIELKEAEEFISKIYSIDPGFKPAKEYFSPRVFAYLDQKKK